MLVEGVVVNVLTVTGRLVADPVRRDTSKGVVCEFRLAVDSRPRLWITVETWGHSAGRCAQYLQAGRRVAVCGALVCDEYVTRNGDKASRWFVRASQITFLDKPDHSGTDIDHVDLAGGVK
jgi:single-strand DNA-binding protein